MTGQGRGRRARRCVCDAERCDGWCEFQAMPTALYCLTDGYWGITHDLDNRLASHRERRGNVDLAEIIWYPNRSDALKAESGKHRG